MHTILNADYAANYERYDLLLKAADAVKEAQTGIELSCYYERPDFMAMQESRLGMFAGRPLTLHGPFTNIEAASEPGSLERRRYIDAWRYAFDVYDRYNASSIVLHTHKARDIAPGDMERLRAWSLDTIQEVARLALDHGAKLTVENVGHWVKKNQLFNEEQFIALFDQLPAQIGCLLDVGHALINRWDIAHVINTLGARITSYHLHNNNGCADSHRPLFEKGNRYSAQEMVDLLLLTNRCSPDAEWILEYAPGEHITCELLAGDLRTLALLNGR